MSRQTGTYYCSCDGKIRHATEGAAKRHIAGINRRKPRGFLHAYRCKFCGGWHVGHVKGKSRDRRAP